MGTVGRGVVVIGMIALVAALGACSSDDSADPPPGGRATTTAPAPADADADADAGMTAISVLGGPDWLAVDGDDLYVRTDNGGVHRIDASTSKVVGSIDVEGETCQGLGAAFDSVWTCSDHDVVRIDRSLDAITAQIPVDKVFEQGTLAGGFDRLWVLTGDGSRLVGIDPATNAPDPPIELGVRGSDLAVSDDGIWVSSYVSSAAAFVDPTTRTVTKRVEGLDDPTGVAIADDGGVWFGGATTARVDPATATVVATIPVGPGPDGAIATEGNRLWIRSGVRFLEQFDAATGEAIGDWDVPNGVTSGGDVTFAGDAVWTSAYDDATVFRIEPFPTR